MNECPFCGESCEPGKAGTYREEIGWALIRGSEGGTNSLKHKRYTGRFAHRWCVQYNPQQELFQDVVQERFPIAEEVQKERFG